MRFLVQALLIAIYLNFIVTQKCTKLVRRPEIRELSPKQLTAFFNAVQKLNQASQLDFFTKHSKIHLDNVEYAHGIPAFLPWHRVYIRKFEEALQKIDSSIILPYWDWSIDSQSPEKSWVFGNTRFGGNGSGRDMCINDGVFKQFRVKVPNNHCLRRSFDEGKKISSFYPPEALEAVIAGAETYDNFREEIEGNPHGAVHNGIGGEKGDISTMYSSNDPLFYLHHAFIDLLWHEWQERNPSKAKAYNGLYEKVSSRDILRPFNIRVDSTLDTRGAGYCYYYNRYSANSKIVKAVSDRVSFFQSPSSRMSSTLNVNSQDIKLYKEIDGYLNSTRSRGFVLNNVHYNDRITKDKIRIPKPLPSRLIQNNRLDENRVRKSEAKLSLIIQVLNVLSTFKPVTDVFEA